MGVVDKSMKVLVRQLKMNVSACFDVQVAILR